MNGTVRHTTYSPLHKQINCAADFPYPREDELRSTTPPAWPSTKEDELRSRFPLRKQINCAADSPSTKEDELRSRLPLHQRPHLFAQYDAAQIIGVIDVENDDGPVVFLA